MLNAQEAEVRQADDRKVFEAVDQVLPPSWPALSCSPQLKQCVWGGLWTGRQRVSDVPGHRKAVARHGGKDEFPATQHNYGHGYRSRHHAACDVRTF